MDVKTALEHCGMTDAHFAAIAESVSEGYTALATLAKHTPMFSQFIPGYRGLAFVRNIAVQYALQTKAASTGLFFTKDAVNASRNHSFLQLQHEQVIITAHYCGAKGSRTIRKAIVRGELAQRTGDLFAAEREQPDISLIAKSSYAQVKHGGLEKPTFAAIVIPNRDQRSYALRPFSLEIVKPDTAKVEEIQDRLMEAFKPRTPNAREQADAG